MTPMDKKSTVGHKISSDQAITVNVHLIKMWFFNLFHNTLFCVNSELSGSSPSHQKLNITLIDRFSTSVSRICLQIGRKLFEKCIRSENQIDKKFHWTIQTAFQHRIYSTEPLSIATYAFWTLSKASFDTRRAEKWRKIPLVKVEGSFGTVEVCLGNK